LEVHRDVLFLNLGDHFGACFDLSIISFQESVMKWVIALVQPHKFNDVLLALRAAEFLGLTVSDCLGFGRQKGRKEIYRGAEYLYDFIPKVRLELAVPQERLSELIEVITSAARTGKIGDGKLFVMDLEGAKRIRTADSGVDAL
jgi:nitrogen regulatory protein P-II 2